MTLWNIFHYINLSYAVCNEPVNNVGCIFLRIKIALSGGQWWILGEANKAVASGLPFLAPPLENSTYRFNSVQMFFRGYYEAGTKSEKCEINSR